MLWPHNTLIYLPVQHYFCWSPRLHSLYLRTHQIAAITFVTMSRLSSLHHPEHPGHGTNVTSQYDRCPFTLSILPLGDALTLAIMKVLLTILPLQSRWKQSVDYHMTGFSQQQFKKMSGHGRTMVLRGTSPSGGSPFPNWGQRRGQ